MYSLDTVLWTSYTKHIVQWLWGGYTVSNPTLNRFFSIHFVLPGRLLSLYIPLKIKRLHFKRQLKTFVNVRAYLTVYTHGYTYSLTNKYGINEPCYSHTVVPKSSNVRRGFAGTGVNSCRITLCRRRQSNLNVCVGFSRNLGYAGFHTTSRSEATLADKHINKALMVVKSKICEVLQTEEFHESDYRHGRILFKNYEKRILKASKKVCAIFTFNNIVKSYSNLRRLLELSSNYTKEAGCLKLPLYQNLSDPCFLLIAFSSLKNKKVGGIDDIPIGNVTLAAILSLSIEIKNKTYSPKPTKKIFIPKANGKMRPLGISSSRDKIIQQALQIILAPLFERVFLDSSHGFRTKRSCHSALKQMYLQ